MRISFETTITMVLVRKGIKNSFVIIYFRILAVIRAVKSVFNSPDSIIETYTQNLKRLRINFEGGATIKTTIVVHRILDQVNKIGKF